MSFGRLGKLGAGFGRLGGALGVAGTPAPGGTAGQPIGLLLILTKAS